MRKSLAFGTSATVMSMALCSPAGAQEAASAKGNDVGGLEEIVVVAQKRSENLQKVPIAISVATSESLLTAGVNDLTSLKMALAGVDLPVSNGFALPMTRGVASKASAAGSEMPTALYVDDVYIASQLSALMSFNSIQQVAALKGPQGTLFGRNATAGLIQITTRDPGGEPSGNVDLSYGNYQSFKGAGYFGGSLTDGVAGDLAVSYSKMGDGYGKNLTNGDDVYKVNHDVNLRSKWILTPADGTTIRFIADYSSQRNSNNANRLPIGETPPAPFGPAYGGKPWDITGFTPFVDHREGGGSLKLTQDLSDLKLVSITAYRKGTTDVYFDTDYTVLDGRVVSLTQKDWQFSQELHLMSSGSGAVNWVAGGYYFAAGNKYAPFNLYINGIVSPPGAPNNINVTGGQKTDSISGFAQVSAALTDQLKLTGGLRYTSEKRTLKDAVQTLRFTGNPTPAVTAFPNDSRRFNKLTWRLALEYQVTPDVLSYLSYNRGFRSGGFNTNALAVAPYSPEVLDAYEVGLKTSFWDRKARLNLATYYYDFKNIQVFVNVNGNTGVVNSGSAKQYGVEAELQLQPVPELTLQASWQYIPTAEYKNFQNSLRSIPRAGGGWTILTGQDVTGNRFLLSPKHTLNLSANYAVNLGDKVLNLNVTDYYNSGYFGEADNVIRQGNYNLVNASVRLELHSGLSLSVWGQNLGDKAVMMQPSISALGGVPTRGIVRAPYGPPRTYGVTVGYAF